VELIPSQMTASRVFVGLIHQLRVPGSARRAVADRHAARLRRREILESPDKDDYGSTHSLLPSV
jgi:hypothetical protein